MIKVGDIVLHTLSNLYFRCENKKIEKWMNMNLYYRKTSKIEIDELGEFYFKKY